jgi:hypothetical protein
MIKDFAPFYVMDPFHQAQLSHHLPVTQSLIQLRTGFL